MLTSALRDDIMLFFQISYEVVYPADHDFFRIFRFKKKTFKQSHPT